MSFISSPRGSSVATQWDSSKNICTIPTHAQTWNLEAANTLWPIGDGQKLAGKHSALRSLGYTIVGYLPHGFSQGAWWGFNGDYLKDASLDWLSILPCFTFQSSTAALQISSQNRRPVHKLSFQSWLLGATHKRISFFLISFFFLSLILLEILRYFLLIPPSPFNGLKLTYHIYVY